MRSKWWWAAALGLAVLLCAGVAMVRGVWGAAGGPLSPQQATGGVTLDATYLGLSMGPLRQARLAALPKGLVLRAGTVEISAKQVAGEIATTPTEIRESAKKNGFFVLENMAVRTLLLAEAHAWAAKTGRSTKGDTADSLTNTYLRSLAADVRVTDAEVRAFYDANPDAVGGAAYAAVAKNLRAYVLDQKRQDAVTAHVQTMSARTPVEVDESWLKGQAAAMLDNPVDKARRSGKPSMIDFGRGGCVPCDMMAPILEELRRTYAAQCNVLFSHVGDAPILAARYGVRSIPVQVFFDKDGREVFRHVGFFPRARIVAKLAELGVR
jgi:thiol-disulfide isomerase/thioredoxin